MTTPDPDAAPDDLDGDGLPDPPPPASDPDFPGMTAASATALIPKRIA